MALIFWGSLLFLFYVEAGYAGLLWLISKFCPAKPTPQINGDANLPSLTVFIAVHNEEKVIRQKLENTLSLDYPREKLQVLVASDYCSDRTEEIVEEFLPVGVQMVRSHEHNGKVAALRLAEPAIRGDVVVFTDADSIFNKEALRKLARHFTDPRAGAVSGREVRLPPGECGNGKGEGLYGRIDSSIKGLEGKVGNQVLVHGGIFAVRRRLLPFVPDHLSHDAIVPLTLTLGGYQTRYEPEAISYEAYDLDAAQDWRRRVRTVLQSVQSYWFVPQALTPFVTGFYAVQIWSHRFARWFVLPALALVLLTSLVLAGSSSLYLFFFLAQAACYLLAFAGYILDRLGKRPALFYFPYYFVYIHAAVFWAVILAARGKKVTTWQPAGRQVIASSEAFSIR